MQVEINGDFLVKYIKTVEKRDICVREILCLLFVYVFLQKIVFFNFLSKN